MTLLELKDRLVEMGYDQATVFVDPDYISAVIGISDGGRVVYSREKMVNYLMENEGMSTEEAQEFIDFNTVRAIPYMGEHRPIIVYPIEE